ncbi:MAG TPA: cytochrome P450 [Steroidobacteraceae bacterium]|nr:cytochrome P450 [Steroidobacteraceae bacterium]
MSLQATQVPAPLFTPEFVQDPYPTYRMHLEGPPIQSPVKPPPHAIAFTYDACVRLFRDPRLSAAKRLQAMQMLPGQGRNDLPYLYEHMGRWLLFRDAPDHTRLRKLMNAGFSPMATERLRATTETAVEELLDAMADAAQPDLVRDLAYPLPVRVISRLLGVPRELEQQCVNLSDAIAVWWGDPHRTVEGGHAAQSAARTLTEMFGTIMRERNSGGGDDLLELLLGISREDGGMSEEELQAQCVLLLFAGHETTRSLIGNAMLTLLRNPEACADVRASDEAIRPAIEEVLRYESPVQGAVRVATEDVEYDGHRIGKGSALLLLTAAAQRDPRRFENPDRFDIHRQHLRHIAFGGDAHVCLGATLARLEGQIAVQRALRRFPRMRLLDPTPAWSPVFGFRGLTRLNVAIP